MFISTFPDQQMARIPEPGYAPFVSGERRIYLMDIHTPAATDPFGKGFNGLQTAPVQFATHPKRRLSAGFPAQTLLSKAFQQRLIGRRRQQGRSTDAAAPPLSHPPASDRRPRGFPKPQSFQKSWRTLAKIIFLQRDRPFITATTGKEAENFTKTLVNLHGVCYSLCVGFGAVQGLGRLF